MTEGEGLDEFFTPSNSQRLSIADINTHWNYELHLNSGHARYQRPKSGSFLKKYILEQKDKNLRDLIGDEEVENAWHNSEGMLMEDEPFGSQIVELVKRGDLSVYIAMDLRIGPCEPSDLIDVDLMAAKDRYYIDRDDLGILLLDRQQRLPNFWYAEKHHEKYAAYFARKSEAEENIKTQLANTAKENKELKARLSKAMPYFDRHHPFFSAELEAAVNCWLSHYQDKKENDAVAKKPKLEYWIKENKADAVKQPDGAVSQSAIDRITMIVNPNKKGGRSPGKA